MTRTEISTLRREKPREFDAMVAERVMGWKVHHRNTAHWVVEDGVSGEYRIMGWTCGNDAWSPSTDANADIAVLREMRTRQCRSSFARVLHKIWTCREFGDKVAERMKARDSIGAKFAATCYEIGDYSEATLCVLMHVQFPFRGKGAVREAV